MIVTLSGGSLSGKTETATILLAQARWMRLPSITTRPPRPSDPPNEYSYISLPQFMRMDDERQFVWVTNPRGTAFYGTRRQDALRALNAETSFYVAILDLHGVTTLWDEALSVGMRDRVFPYFFLAPSDQELRRRGAKRGDSPADIEKHIVEGKTWSAQAKISRIPFTCIDNSADDPSAIARIASSIRNAVEARRKSATLS